MTEVRSKRRLLYVDFYRNNSALQDKMYKIKKEKKNSNVKHKRKKQKQRNTPCM